MGFYELLAIIFIEIYYVNSAKKIGSHNII